MDQEVKSAKLRQRQETYQFRISTLLTLIGLWLALPTTCGVLQRMTDTLTSLDIFGANTTTVIMIKLASDACLLGFYLIGLFLLVFIGISGWIASRTVDTIADGAAIAQASIIQNAPIVNAAVQKRIPILRKLFNKISSRAKRIINYLWSRFQEGFPVLGRFLNRFLDEPDLERENTQKSG